MAELDDEQLARELAEEMRKLRVEDVLVQSLLTISQVGYRRLGMTPETTEDRDLDQVRLAIESMDALTPVLERFVPDQLVSDFRASVSSLKLAYAGASSTKPADTKPAETSGAQGEPSPAEDAASDEAAAGEAATGEAAESEAAPGKTGESNPS
ncbi:MAG: hypothetical protein OXG37_15305 [Actinomycetia bacterium]|nr:hypothetical protein [Actinomycetes bacterium]